MHTVQSALLQTQISRGWQLCTRAQNGIGRMPVLLRPLLSAVGGIGSHCRWKLCELALLRSYVSRRARRNELHDEPYPCRPGIVCLELGQAVRPSGQSYGARMDGGVAEQCDFIAAMDDLGNEQLRERNRERKGARSTEVRNQCPARRTEKTVHVSQGPANGARRVCRRCICI